MSKFLDITGLRKVVENLKKDIKAEVVNNDHLKRAVVETLPEVAAADSNTIYMVKDTSGAGEDLYNEYMVIEDKFELMGKSKTDLKDYPKKSEVTAQVQAAQQEAQEAAKTYADSLAGDYATADQGTKADEAVQSVKLGNKELKSGTTVTIPEATTSLAGAMSAADKNKLDNITAISTDEIDALFA